MPVSSKSDNATALAKYNARYNNDAHRAVREVVEEFVTGDSDVIDIMNLITDAALFRCGHSRYVGTRGTDIS